MARRYMPDPFVLAIALTFLVAILGIIVADGSLSERVGTTLSGWKAFLFEPPTASGGVNRKLLYFAFQMCLMLVTGHALASSPPIQRIVRRLARTPQRFDTAVLLVAFVACLMALVHWGLGLIVGAMIAREVGGELSRRNIPHHYPLLGAAGYTGLMVWGGGLSGSIPLAAAGQAGIALELTLFSPLNLVTSLLLLASIPLTARMLIPADEKEFIPCDDTRNEAEDDTSNHPKTPAQKMDQSRLMVLLLGWPALAILAYEVINGTSGLSFNNLNYAFLFAGLLCHGTPARYVEAVTEATRGCAGIILQFPLYFGILGILVVTGLAGIVTDALINVASESTYAIVTYFSAGLVNLFVPSGGGQWVVQGTIVMNGAATLGGDELLPKSIMALTYGDAWTNMLQPFWAVPLLAITGLRARDIIGYTASIMLVGGAITIACLSVF